MTENQNPDAFEAALAANADEIVAEVAAPEVAEVAEVVTEALTAEMSIAELALASDEDGDI